jgi:tRNA pseudouridine32 synthase/23S rRNA pseudouridine746 synthase
MDISQYIHLLNESLDEITLPKRFTFPFYYTPHKLTLLAANQLQDYLVKQEDWEHNFGLVPDQKGMVTGKMFGVMVVKTPENELGFLAAFSGKLADRNDIPGFVPPIYDMLDKGGYFKTEEAKLDELNRKIAALENDKSYQCLQDTLETLINERDKELDRLKKQFNVSRKNRRAERKLMLQKLNEQEIIDLHKNHKQISLAQQHDIKKVSASWTARVEVLKKQVVKWDDEINQLKAERKRKSNELQQWLFKQYDFLNARGELKNVKDIFKTTALGTPPAGAGECAAPKLLQFAYQNNLKPICFGEFWWGQPPKSEVRKHGSFYPSCKGKCEPILSHMLNGLDVDDNPMNQIDGDKNIPLIYEDDHMIIINKPEELLSVPGRKIKDSVYTRFRHKVLQEDVPLIVHRLDMSTSGLMVLAKTKASHIALQKQFLERSIKKKYIADLNGVLSSNEGEINLPLKLDYINRPQQCVCFIEGKPAKTLWRVLFVKDRISRVEFQPITGRTHQLRVHSAHKNGLNTPIVGDDIYGQKSDRLHLHAAYLEIQHPFTHEIMIFRSEPAF